MLRSVCSLSPFNLELQLGDRAVLGIMKKFALKAQFIVLAALLWAMQTWGQELIEQAQAPRNRKAQSDQTQQRPLRTLQALAPGQGSGLQGVVPGSPQSPGGDQQEDRNQLQGASPLEGADPRQSAGPLKGTGSAQGADPLQSASPLQNVGPLQNAASEMVAAAPSIPNIMLPQRPASELSADLGLTPMQLATLRSGDAVSVNELLSQLLGTGNLSSEALSTLVEALLRSQKLSTQAAPTATPLTRTLPPPVFPFPTNPIDYVSRS